MSVQHKVLGTHFTLPNMPLLVSYINGFIGDSLVDLHLCDGTDTLASVSNRKPGGAPTAVVNSGTATLMTNGGVQLQANAYLPEGAEIDITLPFTVMWHGSVDVPIAGGSSWPQGIIETDQYSTRGFVFYANEASYPSDTTQVQGVARNVVNTSQQTALNLTKVATWTYGDKRTFVVRSDGVSLNYLVLLDGVAIVDFSFSPNFTGMTTNNSSVVDKTMRLCASGPSAVFNKNILSVEGLVVYNRRLVDAELAANDTRFKQIRVARGR